MATNNSTQESVSYNNGTFISDTPGIIVNKSEVPSKIKEMDSSIDKESLKAAIQTAEDSGVLIIKTTNDDEILQLFIYVVNLKSCKWLLFYFLFFYFYLILLINIIRKNMKIR